ncbi:MAG: hypothetical protein ABEJ04_01675 [Halobacteriaceae archaeon]
MSRSRRDVALALCCLALFVAPAVAHVPDFAGENDDPSHAYRVEDPATSRAVYDRLPAGEARYYELHLDAGDRLRVSVYTPTAGPFTPSLVLASPALEAGERVPEQVTLPDGYGAAVVPGEKPAGAAFEPFTPASYYYTVDVDRRVERSGTYLLAVYAPDRSAGAFGIAVGYEERFTPVEYLSVPLDVVGVHLWEGDGPLLVFGPLAATLLGGLALARRRLARLDAERPAVRYAVATSGLLLAGTAAGTLVQLFLALARSGPVWSALLTLGFVLVPGALGASLVRTALADEFALSWRTRAHLLVAAAGGFLAWGGLLVGPALALAVATVPIRR